MELVVIQPNSLTNSSSDYLVVDYADWVRRADGDTQHLAEKGRAKTFSEAEAIRDRLNKAA